MCPFRDAFTRLSRREFFQGGLAAALLPTTVWQNQAPDVSPGAAKIPVDLATPYKLGRLVLTGSGKPGTWNGKSVDVPFVFSDGSKYYMTVVGFDGVGYQTGLASSDNLVDWTSEGVILARNPSNPLTRYNAALCWIVRENDIFSHARLKKIRGRYLGVYHAYPSPGYEEGPAAIGLCWSDDFRKWQVDPPCLRPEEGAPWEQGGLYKPCLVEENGAFYLLYNAKDRGKHWHEQTGLATSRDLRTWMRHPASPLIRNGGPGSPDERFASDPCALRYGKRWAVFYFGLDDRGVARDLLALSPDLVHMEKCTGYVVDVGPPGSIDSAYAHKASIIWRDGVLYHFYCAVSKEDVRGISVATSRPLAKS